MMYVCFAYENMGVLHIVADGGDVSLLHATAFVENGRALPIIEYIQRRGK